MPVFKYRSVEEMPSETWLTPGDPKLYRALRGLWRRSRMLAPRRFPSGVWKHRSMESMNHQREAWDTDYVRALSARRQR